MRGAQDALEAEMIFHDVGLVVIGRNEGERLKRCLASVVPKVSVSVYVDSGSTDDSVQFAEGMGVHVLKLDMAFPFTAARARNEGWARLLKVAPELRFVQFVDGDCEVVDGWLQVARYFLIDNSDYAVACGRRLEKFPDHTIYNRLCDIEWNTPVGDAKACGGDAMIRIEALLESGGYRSDLIAGEEPEMCVRLRQKGWKIRRIDHDMSLHDAAISRFRQWWMRAVRGGFAYAEGRSIHGNSVERHCVNASRRIWFWTIGVPVIAIMAVWLFGASGWVVLLAYPFQVLRLVVRQRGETFKTRLAWASFNVLGKFAELAGQIKFYLRKLGHGTVRIIEYK